MTTLEHHARIIAEKDAEIDRLRTALRNASASLKDAGGKDYWHSTMVAVYACIDNALASRRIDVNAPAHEVGPEWRACRKKPIVVRVRDAVPGEKVFTREGLTLAQPDDLVMRGVDGELYPIGRDVFVRTYDLVSDEEPKGLLPLCTCPATSEYDAPCPRHGVVGIGRIGADEKVLVCEICGLALDPEHTLRGRPRCFKHSETAGGGEQTNTRPLDRVLTTPDRSQEHGTGDSSMGSSAPASAESVRDESRPPPGWEIVDDECTDEMGLGANRWSVECDTLAEAWQIYDAEHGYAPASPDLSELHALADDLAITAAGDIAVMRGELLKLVHELLEALTKLESKP